MPWSPELSRRLGETIRAVRLSLGLSQEKLAQRAQITKNQVQLLEAGRGHTRLLEPISNPKLSTLYGLADALGMDLRDLLPQTDQPPETFGVLPVQG
ncbi:helix-turn-helix transcriptional regulator [Arthrobacter sp. UYEF21]|uniref:helix-turn-helix domain-containing protein n=1 Tax=Arthrobacter sp. UYEF21 TaxID=1756364 RepID=UPI003397E05C